MIDIERLSNQVSDLLHKDVAQQWRGVHLYMEKIRGEVGDVLDDCSELIESNTELMFNDFCNDVLPLSGDELDYFGEVLKSSDDGASNKSYRAIWLIFNYLNNIKEWEQHNSTDDGIERLRKMGEARNNGELYGVYSRWGACFNYNLTHSTFEYRLCRKVFDYLSTTGHYFEADDVTYFTQEVELWVLVRNIQAVFLSIALTNELARIEEQAYIEGITLPSPTEIAPRLPHNERKEHEGTIIPPSNNLTLDEQEAVFTERALSYFKMAIERGYMELTPTHYKWLYGGKRGKVRCGVFLLRVYCPNNTEKLPERALHKLFDMERLDSVITGFQGTQQKQRWLPNIDEMFDD